MSEARPWEGRRIHFVGVGGSGMSGYARAAHALGASVTGSDRADSPYLRRLVEEGVLDAKIGHDALNVPAGEDVEVVYSSAIPVENPERAAARERGLAERSRAALLGELTAMRRTIAVAGAHGKTTTSAMIAWALREQGLDPSWLIGAPIGVGLDNSHWSATSCGEGWLVVEADESDRSMLSLSVDIAVLTNVELDHHATFGSIGELREAYRRFMGRARRALVVWDRPDLLDLAGSAEGAGARETIAFDALEARPREGGCVFEWRGTEVHVGVAGAHNARNAAAALEALRLAGVDGRAGLASFTGAGRRFQRLGQSARGALVIDDYAHHPTEVAATIQAARTLQHERLIAVFQPHLYSRTALFAAEFGAALAGADAIVLLDVYAARERPEDHPGVSGLTLARATAERAGGRPVYWLPSFEQARGVLEGMLAPGDICVVMGAGDVDRLARTLVQGAGAAGKSALDMPAGAGA